MYRIVNTSVTTTQAGQPDQTQRKAVMVLSGVSAIVPVGTTTFVSSYPDAVDAGYDAAALVAFKAFFDNNSNNGVIVLSVATGATGISDFTTWFTANRTGAYFVLVPTDWYDLTEFGTLAASYEGDTDRVYFLVLVNDFTVSGAATSKWVANALAQKSVIGVMQNPQAVAERPDAAVFGICASYGNFSTNNKMTPLNLSFVQNQTAYDVSASLETLAKTNNLNWIDNMMATGGIDAEVVANGVMGDGKNFSYWYGIDYCEIVLPRELTAAVVNGANDNTNPLWYDQNGIDRLAATLVGTLNTALSYALIAPIGAGPGIVSAQSFSSLSDSVIASGVYSGFAVTVKVQAEFKTLNLNVNFTELSVTA